MTERPAEVARPGFEEVLNGLAEHFGLVSSGRRMTPTVAKLLSSLVCERRLVYELEHYTNQSSVRFDSFYAEMSRFATIKILDHLKTKLLEEGFTMSYETERKDAVGKYDVAIHIGPQSSILLQGTEQARVEVKAVLSLPLEQIERYLWNPSPLIIARILTGQVAVLRRDELKEFVEFSKAEAVAKAERVLSGDIFVVPGDYCRECRDTACKYNSLRESPRPKGIVSISRASFQHDLTAFLRNLPKVADAVAEAVLEEMLRNATADLGANIPSSA